MDILKTLSLSLSLVLFGSTAVAQDAARVALEAREKQGLEQALYIGNLTVSDLKFEKKLFRHAGRSAVVDMSLDDPLTAADLLLGAHADALGLQASRALEMGRERFLSRTRPARILAQAPADFLRGVPNDFGALKTPIGNLLYAIRQANEEVRAATSRLEPAERRTLIESLPALAVEEPMIRFAFARNPNRDRRAVFALLERVDLDAIGAAGASLAAAIEREMPGLKAAAEKEDLAARKVTVQGMVLAIGGKGSDRHEDTNAVLTLDFGGDDVYVGRHGAGAGYASVLIDLDGDDLYKPMDLSIGAGLLGIGLAHDLKGNDRYFTQSLALGCGIAGVGLLDDASGDDVYDSMTLAQGFGQFGIGMLRDGSGDDRYGLRLYGQGAARTSGIGWLLDGDGSDQYRAGGMILNSPLFADVHYSFAQGYASGYREDTGGVHGGIGLLTDASGDDTYIGETYCQAASYWYSLGSLYDGSGHDTYTAHHYAQASAMHATAAYLFDLAGDDAYAVKFGASHAIGHDFGVAFLLDRAGNDVYAGRDSRPGIGVANGLGIFLDASGEDRYMGPAGTGSAARGSGSLGVFADLDGPDLYRAGLADAAASVATMWGVALDAPSTARAAPTGTATGGGPRPTPGSQPVPSQDALGVLYDQATQWAVGTAAAQVESALNNLLAIGQPAFEWMVNQKLAGADRLELRAFAFMIEHLGAPARALVAPKIASPNVEESRAALSLVTTSRAIEAAPYLAQALGSPVHQRSAALAAGAVLGGRVNEVPVAVRSGIVARLSELAGMGDRSLALAAMVALADIADPVSFSTAEAALLRDDLPIRRAALAYVAKFGEQARMTGSRLASSPEERTARIGIEVLAAVGDSAALAAAGKYLKDTRAGVRIQAALALDKRCPAEFRADLLALRQDSNPWVKAVASRIEPGR